MSSAWGNSWGNAWGSSFGLNTYSLKTPDAFEFVFVNRKKKKPKLAPLPVSLDEFNDLVPIKSTPLEITVPALEIYDLELEDFFMLMAEL
jgi:hypothetical protein